MTKFKLAILALPVLFKERYITDPRWGLIQVVEEITITGDLKYDKDGNYKSKYGAGFHRFASVSQSAFCILTQMSKRPSSSNERPLAKRSRRQAGFRLARPAPVSLEPSSSSNTSLFVTVSDEQRGTLQAQNRIISSVPDPPVSTPDISTPSFSEYDTSLPPEADTEIQDKTKRKRNTTNAVSYTSQFLCQNV